MDRDQVAEAMNVKPGTVASYIIKALALNSELPFDADRLHELAQGVFLRDDEKALLADLLRQEAADTSNVVNDEN
jgi:antitoxin component of RelBE/YafQ-DinJ toxin-antitoxin module